MAKTIPFLFFMNKYQRLVKLFKPRVLVRLTYPAQFPPPEIALKHLNKLMEYLKGESNKGIWFMTTQERGAPMFYMMLTRFVPKDVLAKKWYDMVASGDRAHLLAGTSVSGFQFQRGAEMFIEKTIGPLAEKDGFRSGTFGSLKAKLLSILN